MFSNLHRLNPIPAAATAAAAADAACIEGLTLGARDNLVSWAEAKGVKKALQQVQQPHGRFTLRWQQH
jgi:hypothetical protein